MDVAGLSNAGGGLLGAPCALLSPPAPPLTAAAAGSAPAQRRLQFDPPPGPLPPLTKSLPQLLHILISAAKPLALLLQHRDPALPAGHSPSCLPCSG